MTTTTTTHAAADAAAPAGRSLPARTAMALVAAVVGNLVLSQALAAAVDADPDFIALQPASVALASAVGVVLGAAALVVLRRLGRPRLLVPLVAVGALLSLGGPLSLLGATPAEQPGASDAAALALIPLHLLVAVVVALLLPSRIDS